MNYKKIALFFLVLFSFNQILPMENEIPQLRSLIIGIIAVSFILFSIGIGLTHFYETSIKKRIKNFLKFDFFEKKSKKKQIECYTKEFKTACLNKDMKTLKNFLEQDYYILKNSVRCQYSSHNFVEMLQDPRCYTVQTPFFIACNEENEDFLSSLILKKDDSKDFFKIYSNFKLFLAFAIKNNQEKAIELLLKYSTGTENKIDINWNECANNAVIKPLLRYLFNNIDLKNAWQLDNSKNNKELTSIILDSLQYLTNKDQQLDLYMRAIINKDTEISNKLKELYTIGINSSYKDDKATTGYQKLLLIYLNMYEKSTHNGSWSWGFNDIKIAKSNIEDIIRNQINNQNDKLALIKYLRRVCYDEKLNMAKILLNFNDPSVNSWTLFDIVLSPCLSNIEIINLLLDDSRITSFDCESSECERNENNQTFFYSFYEKHFKHNNVEKLNEINYVKRKITNKKIINSELQSAATILFNDKDVAVKIDCYGNRLLNLDCFIDYIDFCLNNGGDLTQRDKDKKLPLDYACEQYESSFKYMSVNSTQFWIKEKIYHIFLFNTPCIKEYELNSLLLNNKIPQDCVNIIMRYNFINNIDRYIAEAVNSDDYYGKGWPEKKKIKETIISKKREELKISLGIGS